MGVSTQIQPGPLVAARPWRKNLRSWFWGYFFVAPSMLGFLVFGLYPMVDNIILSFQQFSFLGNSWVGLQNYSDMFADEIFQKSLVDTFLYFIGIVPLSLFISVLIGILIYQHVPFVQTVLKTAYYMPVVASGVVLSLIWTFLYDPAFGPLTYLIQQLHGPHILWLSDPNLALWSLVLMIHSTGHGASIILVVAALGAVPEQLYEAAKIDGASRFQQAVSITLPLLKPVIAYIVIIGTISTFQIFTEPYIMTKGGPDWATSSLSYYIYYEGFQELAHWGLGASAAMLMLVVTVVLAIVQFRFLASDVEY